MNIVIINQYCENRGDEAAGSALIYNILKKTNCRIDIIYNSAYKLDIDFPNVYHRNEDLRLKNIGKKGLMQYFIFRRTFLNRLIKLQPLKEFIRTINNADVIFVAPCGASIGIYKDWAFLVRLLMVIKEKKTPIFCLNTIGKSGNVVFDILARYILKKSCIYVRDQESYEYIKKLNLEVEKGIDMAFSLPKIEASGIEKKLVFVPADLNWHPTFRNRDISREILEAVIPALIQFCVKENCKLEILPHTYSNYEMQLIEKIDKDVKQKYCFENINIQKNVKEYNQYDEVIANAHMVVGMRYHSIVLAAKNHVPFVALAYEYKMIEVSKYTNCMEWVIDIRNVRISEKDIWKKLIYINGRHDDNVNHLKKSINETLLAKAMLPLKNLDEVLK